MAKFKRAPEIDPIADAIIDQFHEHLAGVRILHLFTTKPRMSGGKLVLGKTQKLSGVAQYLSSLGDGQPYDFLMVFDEEQWRAHDDDPDWQSALVDHECCHIVDQVDAEGEKTGEWVLAAHDVEEFTTIVRRRGLWTQDLKDLGYAVGDQVGLPGFGLEPVRVDATTGEIIGAIPEGGEVRVSADHHSATISMPAETAGKTLKRVLDHVGSR